MAMLDNLDRNLSPDLIFACSDGEVNCHKLVICSFSPFVKQMLKECGSNVIIMPDVKKIDFVDVLDVSYGVQLETNKEESMKTIFKVLCVNSKDILINNVNFELENSKKKKVKSKRGLKKIKFQLETIEPETQPNLVTQNDSPATLHDTEERMFNPNVVEREGFEIQDHDYVVENKRGVACDKCQKVCKSKRGLAYHMKNKHKEDYDYGVENNGGLACDKCQKVCKSQGGLATI